MQRKLIDLEKDKKDLESIIGNKDKKETESCNEKDLYSLSRDELKKICEESGIDTKKKKKNEMIKLIQKLNEEEDFEDYLVSDSIL
jgi:hypothetical protein